jgi:HAD superfamily hydrolase (TIGR01509 family)
MSTIASRSHVKRFNAVLFDVDGTIAETEEFHRRAFNESFSYFNLPWFWDVSLYGKLLRVAGGKERIRHFLNSPLGLGWNLSDGEIGELHRLKTVYYESLIYSGECKLRPAIAELIRKAPDWRQRRAIVTTTSRRNVDALMTANLGQSWQIYFDFVVCGDEVAKKKPAPDAYLSALRFLDLPARSCLAVEDSRNGLVAASAAGLPVLITRSIYFRDDDFKEAIQVIDDLTELENFCLANSDVR